MLVDLPTSGTFDALVLSGVAQSGDEESAVLAVVLKAAYDLVDAGTGVHDMVPAADRMRAALVLQDEGTHLFTDANGVHVLDPDAFGVEPADPEVPGSEDRPYFDLGVTRHFIGDLAAPEGLDFDLRREADVAIDKAEADLFVTGFNEPDTGGAVRVDGSTWLTRAAGNLGSLDPTRHLFGWHGRRESPRSLALASSYDPDVDGALPDGDTAAFNNAYRRSLGFSAPGSLDLGSVPAGALVEIFRNPAASGSPDFVVRLPDLTMGYRLRVYCGHGPDRARRWRIVPRGDLLPDTLLLRPGAASAEILWRGRWPANVHPQDRYRSVQIRAGGF